MFDFEVVKQGILRLLAEAPNYLPAINSTAVLSALIAGWIVGWIWYAIAGQIWHDAIGKSGLGAFSPRRQIFVGIAQVVMTIMLANFMERLKDTSMLGGANTALLLWFGFVMTTILVNYANLGARLGLTIVDGIHWLLVLVVMGGMIGLVNDLGLGVKPGEIVPKPLVSQSAPAQGTAPAPANGEVAPTPVPGAAPAPAPATPATSGTASGG